MQKYVDIDGLRTFKNELEEKLPLVVVNSDTYATKAELNSKASTDTATTSSNGLMSAADKVKLDDIESNAQVNVIESVKVNNTALTPSSKAVNIDLSNYVVKDGDKVLSTNDYTTAEKNKLANIPSDATSNVIESVKVNNTALIPSSKAVNIDLSNYVVKDGSKVLSSNDFTDYYKSKLDEIIAKLNKPDPELTFSTDTAIIVAQYSDNFIVSSASNGAISATSADSDIATVTVSDSSLVISGIASGTTSITVTIAETNDYASATATLPVTIEEFVSAGCSMSANKTSVTVVHGESDTVTFTIFSSMLNKEGSQASISANGPSWMTINNDNKTITFAPPSTLGPTSTNIVVTATCTYRQVVATNQVTIIVNVTTLTKLIN